MLFVFSVEVLEKERIDRERVDAERQQQLINSITTLLNVNLPKIVEKVSQKQIKGLYTTLTKNITQTIDNALTKHLENFKKWMLQAHLSLQLIQPFTRSFSLSLSLSLSLSQDQASLF
jgi:hypothetical protein